MTRAEMLRAAKALIADERHWVQGHYALDSDGCRVDPNHEDANRFCAIGALAKVSGKSPRDVEDGFVGNFLNIAARGRQPWHINDDEDHDAVMMMYDRAIELAEEEENS